MGNDEIADLTAADQWQRDQQLMAFLRPQLMTAEAKIALKQQTWDRMEKLWHSFRFGKPFPWRSNIFNPISFFLVETILPQMALTTFQGYNHVLEVRPIRAEDVEVAEKEDALVNYQLTVEMQPILQWIKFTKSGLILGTGAGKAGWDFEEQSPFFRHVSLRTLLYDADSEDQEDNEKNGFYAQKLRVSKMHLRMMEAKGMYRNVEQVKGSAAKSPEELQQEQMQGYQPVVNKRDIELTEGYYWCPESLIVKGGSPTKIIKSLVTIAGQVVVRAEPNPLPKKQSPFLTWVDHVELMGVYGYGELEPIESLQWMSNDLYNQYLDNRKMELNSMWVASRTADIDYRALVSRPNGVILAGDPNGLVQLQHRNSTATHIADQRDLFQAIQMGTGTSLLSAGIQGKSPETATGTELLQAAAGKRVALKILLNQLLGLVPLGQRMVQYNSMYLPDNKRFRILGDQPQGQPFITMTTEERQGKEFDVMAIPMSQYGSPQTQARDLMALLQMIITAPTLQLTAPLRADVNPLYRKIAELEGIKDYRIFQSEQPAVDVLAQARQQVAQQGGGQRLGMQQPGAPVTPNAPSAQNGTLAQVPVGMAS